MGFRAKVYIVGAGSAARRRPWACTAASKSYRMPISYGHDMPEDVTGRSVFGHVHGRLGAVEGFIENRIGGDIMVSVAGKYLLYSVLLGRSGHVK